MGTGVLLSQGTEKELLPAGQRGGRYREQGDFSFCAGNPLESPSSLKLSLPGLSRLFAGAHVPAEPPPSTAQFLAGLQGPEAALGDRGDIVDGPEVTAGLSGKQLCERAGGRTAQLPSLQKKRNKGQFVGLKIIKLLNTLT